MVIWFPHVFANHLTPRHRPTEPPHLVSAGFCVASEVYPVRDLPNRGMPNNHSMRPRHQDIRPPSNQGTPAYSHFSDRTVDPRFSLPAPHFSTKRTSRPRIPKGKLSRPPPGRPNGPQLKTEEQLKCSLCPPDDKTFGRLPELLRHMRSFHAGPDAIIRCPVANCTREKPFPSARKDKLMDHIRSVHRPGPKVQTRKRKG